MTRSNALVRSLEHAFFRAAHSALRIGHPRDPVPEPIGNQTALICKWCCLGDAVVSLYAIREFKSRYPEVRIEMLVSTRIAAVYRRAPEIGDVHVLPVTGKRLLLELIDPRLWIRFLRLASMLRRRRYSQFIDLELYRGTGPILKRMLGIPYSRGFQVEGALPKHHDFEVPLPRSMPEWQCFYRVLGLEVPSSAPEALYPRPARKGLGNAAIPVSDSRHPANQANQANPEGRRTSVIGVVFGSSFNWPQKKWPAEKYAELIGLLAPDGHRFVLFGTADEKEEAARIAALSGVAVTDTSGTLDFAGLRNEVAACDLVIGNDTGTLHLAAACGVPTLTLFGPTDPDKWNPLTSTPVFLEQLACRPCYYLGSMPPCSHFSCLRKLEADLVADKARRLLASPETAPGGGSAAPEAHPDRKRISIPDQGNHGPGPDGLQPLPLPGADRR